MPTPINPFKRAILAHRVQIGFWLAIGDPVTAEICAGAGFDWLVVDAEHGPQHQPGILAQLQAIAAYPECHAVVRVPSDDPTGLKQYLDLGAQSVLVPMVETAAQASAVVRACRYAPEGDRGIGGARASGWGRHADYLRDANSQICVIVQVETIAGIRNLHDIAAVPGLDAVFIGPADLAASMGHIGNPDHPDVRAAVIGAIAQIVRAGKPAGILTRDEELARDVLALGACFVAVGIDTLLLAQQTSALAQHFHDQAAAIVRTTDA